MVILVDAAVALVRVGFVVGRSDRFGPMRLDLGRLVVLGSKFQLAGDLLRTAVAPSFTEIGPLAAIAAIRTVLNYFLRLEIRQNATGSHEPLRDGGRPREPPRRIVTRWTVRCRSSRSRSRLSVRDPLPERPIRLVR